MHVDETVAIVTVRISDHAVPYQAADKGISRRVEIARKHASASVSILHGGSRSRDVCDNVSSRPFMGRLDLRVIPLSRRADAQAACYPVSGRPAAEFSILCPNFPRLGLLAIKFGTAFCDLCLCQFSNV